MKRYELHALAGDGQTSLEALHCHFEARLAQLGFDRFRLARCRRGQLVDTPLSSDAPLAATAAGSNRQFAAILDPVSTLALGRSGPIFWRELPTEPQLPQEIRDYLGSAGARSLYDALTIPIHGPNEVCDIWEFGRSAPLGVALGTIATEELCGIAFVASAELRRLRPIGLPAAKPRHGLSDREIEVLNWCKEGKSYAEIASVMGISSKTVDYHMSNAMRKLGVNQKLTAIVAATKLGIIDL